MKVRCLRAGLICMENLVFYIVVQLNLIFGVAGLAWPDKLMPCFGLLCFPAGQPPRDPHSRGRCHCRLRDGRRKTSRHRLAPTILIPDVICLPLEYSLRFLTIRISLRCGALFDGRSFRNDESLP